MKKRLNKLMSFLMSVFMILEIIMPSFYSMAQEELDEKDNYKIEQLSTYGKDDASKISLKMATMIDDKNMEAKNKISFALETIKDTKEFKLITRKDFDLYDTSLYQDQKDAEEEFDKVKERYAKQGLDLDISLVEDNGRYRIHNNSEDDEKKKDFGKNYKSYSFKVNEDFDFDKKGLQNKIKENIRPERLYVFNFEIKKSLDTSFNMISVKDDEETEESDEADPDPESTDKEPIKVKNEGDLLAVVADGKYFTTYGTSEIKSDMEDAIKYKEEKIQKEKETAEKKKQEEEAKKAEEERKAEEEKRAAEEKAKEEAEKKAEEERKAQEEKQKAEEEKKAQEEKQKQEEEAKRKAEEEKAQAEKEAASQKENEGKKESKTEIITEENKEEKKPQEKADTKTEEKSQESTKKEEETLEKIPAKTEAEKKADLAKASKEFNKVLNETI